MDEPAAPKRRRAAKRKATKAPKNGRAAASLLAAASAGAVPVASSSPADKKLKNWKQIRRERDAKEAASLEAIQARQATSPPPAPLPATDAEWDALIRLLPGFDPYALAGDCEFVPEAAADAIEFIEKHVRHHEGDLGGQLLRMEPWQRAFIANLFGWVKPDGVTRRFHDAFLYVGKKNGKSLLCEGIALYLFLGDGEFGAKVYCAAAKRDQARIIWDGCLWQIKNDPELDALCDRYQYTITKTDSGFLKPISADADKEDGMNPSGFVMDEVHRQPDSRLASMAKKSMKTRRNHLYVGLTTSGEDGESFVNDELARFKAVRDNKGDPMKPGYFPDMLPAIYEADDGDDWTKVETWRKANPSLGVSIPVEEIAKECREAVESPALVADFLRYRLNMRVKTTSAMFDMRAWDKCGAPLDPKTLYGKRCWIGIDLSSTTDITAQVALFEDGSVLCWFWVPEEAARARDKRNDGLYLGWARSGFLTLTHGDQIDETRVLTEMIENARPFKVVEWDFDPYSASRFTQRLLAEGVAVVSVRQGSWTMSEPLKALTVMVGNGQLKHGGHPVLRWMAANAEREIDKKDNWTLTKPKGFLKIDGIAALATAKTRAMVAPAVVDAAPFTATFIPWKRNVG